MRQAVAQVALRCGLADAGLAGEDGDPGISGEPRENALADAEGVVAVAKGIAERGEPLARTVRAIEELLDQYGLVRHTAAIDDTLAREVLYLPALRKALLQHPPELLCERVFTSPSDDAAVAVAVAVDGAIVVAGSLDKKLWLAKLAP